MKNLHLLFTFFLLWLTTSIYSQTFTFTNPQNFFVCHDAPFQFSVHNNTNTTEENIKVTLSFPCEMEYVPGSISGAVEHNITDLTHPVFILSDLASNENASVIFWAQAPCAVSQCVDAGQLFTYNITYESNSTSSTNASSNQFEIGTSLLLFTQVSDPIVHGQKGDIIHRQITIRNTRPGPVKYFVFTDTHDEGLEISMGNGTVMNNESTLFKQSFSGVDFMAIGDGDTLFEQGEEMIVEEEIHITACVENTTIKIYSGLSVEWGCNNEACSNFSSQAIIFADPNDDLGDILKADLLVTEIKCNNSLLQEGVSITNLSDHIDASDIKIDISTLDFPFLEHPVTLISNGDTTYITPELEDNIDPTTCFPLENTYTKLAVTIPHIAPNTGVTLLWDMVACNSECAFLGVEFSIHSDYQKDCTVSNDIHHNLTEVHQSDTLLVGTLGALPLEDNQDQTLTYFIRSPNQMLSANSGTLSVALDFPCGMLSTMPIDFSLENIVPSNIDISNDGQHIEIEYPMPLPFDQGTIDIPIHFNLDTLCYDLTPPKKDSLLSSCSHFCEKAPGGCLQPPTLVELTFSAAMNIAGCAPGYPIQYCNFQRSSFTIEPEGVCVDSLVGYPAYSFSMKRSTYGLPDNNDDHIPDNNGMLNFDNIRLDRAVQGDTVRTQMHAVVIEDYGETAFPHAYFNLTLDLQTTFGVAPETKHEEIVKLLNPENGFINYQKRLQIYDKSQNIYYQCPQAHLISAEILGEQIVYKFDFSPSQQTAGNIPLDFKYAKGDSILFDGRFIINYNFENGQSYGIMGLFIEPKIYLSDYPNPSDDERYLCHCKTSFFEIGNILNFAGQDGFKSISLCSNLTDDGFILPMYTGVYPNFFPNEYRQTVAFRQLRIPKVAGLDLTHSYIEFATLNGEYILNYPDTTEVHFSYIEPAAITYPNEDVIGFYVFKLSDMPELFWDDNVYVRFRFNYTGENCSFKGGSTYLGDIDFDWLPQNLGYKEEINKSIGLKLKGKNPNLSITFDFCDQNALSDSISWDFILTNTAFSCATNSFATDAPNTWLYPTDNAHLLENFRLINRLNNTEINDQNGFFQVGNINKCDTLRLRLIAKNTSCSPVQLKLNYGWNCSPVSDPIQESCNANATQCTIFSPPGVVDIVPDITSQTVSLCDTTPWSSVKVFNAGLGSIFDLILDAHLPPGVVIQNATSQIEWPAGSNIFLTVTNPTDMGNQVFRWTLTDELDTLTLHGLPGITSAPNNSATLRFKATTNCNFISGSAITYTTSGKKLCNLPTNSVSQIGAPIFISGISQPYETSIALSISEMLPCSDTLTINANFNLSSPSGNTDKIIAQLPANISYVPNSCSGSINCVPTVIGNELHWTFPQGITFASLSFQLIGFSDYGCQSLSIPFLTTTQSAANCQNQNCNIQVQTGNQQANINLKKPSFFIDNFTALPLSANNNLAHLSVQITNIGIINTDSIVVRLYLDQDSDDQVSAGDNFVASYSFAEYLDNGNNATLDIFAQAVSPSDICKLLVSIGTLDNCACSSTVQKVTAPIFYPATKIDTICSGASIPIGFPASLGANYLWNNQAGIGCQSCAETFFTQVNESFNPKLYTLILKENGTCLIEKEYQIVVMPKLRIWEAPESICQGDEATLIAAEGDSYFWQGEDILDPSLQIQTVSPTTSTPYILTVTNAYCQATDTVFVNVEEIPIAQAGDNISICFGATAQLSTGNIPDGSEFFWTPGAPYLDDPTASNPTVLTTENTTFTLQVSNGLCSSTDEVQVLFFDGVDLIITPDQNICLGDTVSIEVTGADTYFWTPSMNDQCQNSSCSTIEFVPTESTHLTVKGKTEDGCIDTIGVQINIIQDTLLEQSTMEICSGASAVLFGQEVSVSGMYCDTIVHGYGCLEISCVELSLLDSILQVDAKTICQNDSIIFQGQVLYETGQYCHEATSSSGCDSTYCVDLQVLPNPEILIAPNNPTIQLGEQIEINVTDDYAQYIWTPNNLVNCIDCPSTTVSPTIDTWFYVAVTDIHGCLSTDSIFVKVEDIEPSCHLDADIPTAFSPNGDHLNDVFRLLHVSPTVSRIELFVYDRWGTKVFNGKDNSGWDGTYQDKVLPEDTYVYLAVLTCPSGEKRLYKGDLTLIH